MPVISYDTDESGEIIRAVLMKPDGSHDQLTEQQLMYLRSAVTGPTPADEHAAATSDAKHLILSVVDTAVECIPGACWRCPHEVGSRVVLLESDDNQIESKFDAVLWLTLAEHLRVPTQGKTASWIASQINNLGYRIDIDYHARNTGYVTRYIKGPGVSYRVLSKQARPANGPFTVDQA